MSRPSWRTPAGARRVPRARPIGRTLPLVLAVATVLGAAACGPRQVEVGTGAAATRGDEPTIELTNNLDQAVNVYVRGAGGSEIFLRQVPARSTESILVRGLAVGTSATLRAAPVDGRVSYTQENVVLARGTAWRVP